MLMQGLMPIFLMYCFKEHKLLREAIRQLSLFFKVLCSKVIDREELRLMHERVMESLCVFEMYFPPGFFCYDDSSCRTFGRRGTNIGTSSI